jgi:hypothetical protein
MKAIVSEYWIVSRDLSEFCAVKGTNNGISPGGSKGLGSAFDPLPGLLSSFFSTLILHVQTLDPPLHLPPVSPSPILRLALTCILALADHPGPSVLAATLIGSDSFHIDTCKQTPKYKGLQLLIESLFSTFNIHELPLSHFRRSTLELIHSFSKHPLSSARRSRSRQQYDPRLSFIFTRTRPQF